MRRWFSLAILAVVFCAVAAWPKWTQDEQKYLDDNFRAIREQVQALKSQVDILSATLTELRQSQVELQAELVRQQRSLHELEQAIAAMRQTNDESLSSLKAALEQLRAENQKALASLAALPTHPTGGETMAAGKPATGLPAAVQGYVTVVQGNSVMVDLGSAQGLRPGARLVVYKANDPNTRVGMLEVTEVVDAGNSRTRIVTMNTGVRPDFSDIVRLE